MIAAVRAPKIGFDAAAHLYRVGGVIIPSVTQILEDCGLVDYSFLSERQREEAMARGSRVHAACYYDDQDDLDDRSVPPGEMGYVEAWRKFRRESGFVPEVIEERAFNEPLRYCGTPDRKGHFPNRKGMAVVDLKTGTSPGWVRYQLAAYGAMEPRCVIRVAVELHADSTYRAQEYPAAELQADMAVFMAAATVYEAKRRTN